MQMILDRSRVMNLHKYGCDCNRDMLKLVRSEPRIGTFELCERKQFGHMYLLVAYKNAKVDEAEVKKPPGTGTDGKTQSSHDHSPGHSCSGCDKKDH